jgi:hypothetical protein
MLLFPLIFSITSTVLFYLGLVIFSSNNYEATFLVSQAVLYATVPLYPGREINSGKFFKMRPGSYKYAFLMVMLTVVAGVTNLYIYQDQILVSLGSVLVNKIYTLLSYTFIPFAQIGGWLYQGVLVYLIAVVVGTSLRFRDYLIFVGIAYSGYLLSTLLSLILNLLVYDLQLIQSNAEMRFAIGKFGEALTLILLAFFIYYNEEKFSLIRSCVIACIPTVIIILFQIML